MSQYENGRQRRDDVDRGLPAETQDGMAREMPEGTDEIRPLSSGFRVLFDVSHPAQVHLFRHSIERLRDLGHETLVTSREKEVTTDLLDAYDISHVPISTRGTSMGSLVIEHLTREVRLLQIARQFDPDVIVSRLGPVPAHVGAVSRTRYVAVDDTRIDSALLRLLVHGTTLPFVDTICLPDDFEVRVPAERRRTLDFQELAYLSPRYFDPDPSVLRRNGIDPDEPYSVIRVAGWDAYHDVGHSGLSKGGLDRLVEILSSRGELFISAEYQLPPHLEEYTLPTPPEAIHQVLYHADLYVGDSGTMSTEAAMLGTPAIRTNSMVGSGDENVFRALEERYGLLRSFANEDTAIRAVEDLLEFGIDYIDWEDRRRRLLADQPDVTERLVDIILESSPDPTTGMSEPP